MIELVGYVAAFLATGAFIPQAYKTIKSGSTKDISLLMYLAFCAGVFLWLVYGVLKNDLPLIIANATTVCLSGTILFIKARNVMRNSEKM